MKLLWQCMFSPRLYTIHRSGAGEMLYQPNFVEKWCNRVLTSMNVMVNIGIYTSPFICYYIYKRGFFSIEETKSLARILGGLGCLIAISFLLRGMSRATNPKYLTFLRAFTAPQDDRKKYFQGLRNYDFDFKYWPVNFALPPLRPCPWVSRNPFSKCANEDLAFPLRTLIQILAYIATHTFALRLVYPGTLSLIYQIVWSQLLQGRAILVDQFDGQRAKLRTADGNDLDTMFIDNRKASPKGEILVICCEGNSGFYEMGIMSTPAKAGYSTIGWNHPGFAESTGVPFPSQEQNAMDAVMQYAITELGFKAQDTVMFGWSIGGYAVSWAAVNYPVKGLILDATFDDLLPLAENQMPKSWSLLVKEVIRSYINLDIADLVTQYRGPVQFIRRTEDEIICLQQGLLSSNRGNNLVLRVIETRHFELLQATASEEATASLDKYIALTDAARATLQRTDISEADRTRLYLINLYLRDYKSSHCTPLPERLFEAAMDNIIFKKK